MKEILEGIFLVDSLAFGEGGLTACYLIKEGDEYLIIDPGFPGSDRTIWERLKDKGISPGMVKAIILTHFHIDHSGACGAMLAENPEMRVYVHKRSAYYVKNFGKIIGGARMVFRTALSKGFSEAVPVAAERVFAVEDGDYVEIGGRRLKVIHSPGHSPDNICVYDEKTGAIFTGDLSCLQYPALNRVYIPAGSPPLFELNTEIDSLKNLGRYDITEILTPHFGPAGLKRDEYIEKSINAIVETRSRIKEMFKEGLEFQHMVERLRGEVIKASGKKEDEIPIFIRDVYLREMLKTGLMGFLAFLLEYAPYPRGFGNYDQEIRINSPYYETAELVI